MPFDDVRQFIDPLWVIPPRAELDIFSDGDHVVAFSKKEWDFVVKILKEENDPELLRRHKNEDALAGLVARFQIVEQSGKTIIIQEKITCFLDERLRQLVQAGKMTEAMTLVANYVEFNLRLWQKGRFDWHFRINHCGLNASNQVVAFDIGGIRGRPDFNERLRWLFGYFGRKHKKNTEILNNINPELADHYKRLAKKKLTRRNAERAIFSGEEG
jgi:hypothetical protein